MSTIYASMPRCKLCTCLLHMRPLPFGSCITHLASPQTGALHSWTWNLQLLTTLHMCRDVVVLAEQDKAWMDEEMKMALKGYDISWQTREGSPYAAADLLRVSAGSSSMIVLMRPESGEVRPLLVFCQYAWARELSVIGWVRVGSLGLLLSLANGRVQMLWPTHVRLAMWLTAGIAAQNIAEREVAAIVGIHALRGQVKTRTHRCRHPCVMAAIAAPPCPLSSRNVPTCVLTYRHCSNESCMACQ